MAKRPERRFHHGGFLALGMDCANRLRSCVTPCSPIGIYFLLTTTAKCGTAYNQHFMQVEYRFRTKLQCYFVAHRMHMSLRTDSTATSLSAIESMSPSLSLWPVSEFPVPRPRHSARRRNRTGDSATKIIQRSSSTPVAPWRRARTFNYAPDSGTS